MKFPRPRITKGEYLRRSICKHLFQSLHAVGVA
jgi:hypothetical protein